MNLLTMGRICFLIFMVTLSQTFGANDGWIDKPNTQYHIQTDEGPERFFRYQTISGQYRKEKRLQDGTVVGTTGWVDPNGYLRLQDYIADNEGYRILKTKMLFVGSSRSLEQAVAVSKKVPASNGILVTPGQSSVIPPKLYPVTYSTTTITPITKVTPSYVRISPNAIETSTKSPIIKVEISPHGAIGSTTLTPISATEAYTTTPTPIDSTEAIAVISTTVEPPTVASSTYKYPTSTAIASPSPTTFRPSAPVAYTSSTPVPFVSNSLSYVPARFPPRYTKRPYIDPYTYLGEYTSNPNNEHPWAYKAGSEFPLRNVPAATENYYNQIGNGYTKQLPEYDGISVTRNGFRYYLPRQYHEEETLSGDQRTGSFGYIDPFGIRRVIYYNSGPGTGFVHKKNNRYVGFRATPYDPRPY